MELRKNNGSLYKVLAFNIQWGLFIEQNKNVLFSTDYNL